MMTDYQIRYETRLLTNSQCKILGNALGYLIQVFLCVAVIASLLYKRHIEVPKREMNIWLLDIGKLLIGGFFTHLANIIVSGFILNSNSTDECSWYFINFFVDCTVGVGIVYIAHNRICYLIDTFKGYKSDITKIGYYNNPIDITIWMIQNLIYLSSLFINKIIITGILYTLKQPVGQFGNWLFSPFHSNPNLELIIVMVICPWILTTFQFWIFDIMLKWTVKIELNNFENEFREIDITNPLPYNDIYENTNDLIITQ